jgi:hypothetical protein
MGESGQTATMNFGQRPFAYTPPTGFKALNTQNLPEPTIVDGGEYFNTVLYTGNGSTQSITGFGFQPDFIWDKSRSSAFSHMLVDAVRGVGKYLRTNLTSAEVDDASILTSFDSDGNKRTDIYYPAIEGEKAKNCRWCEFKDKDDLCPIKNRVQ